MTFDEMLAQVLDLLQRQGRVSYRAMTHWPTGVTTAGIGYLPARHL
jgi:hypothetical protein